MVWEKIWQTPPEKITGIQLWQLVLLIKIDIIKYRAYSLSKWLKAKIWNAKNLLWWYRLWIREDEFDVSLQKDITAYEVMSKNERHRYDQDRILRQQIAHKRFMAGMTKKDRPKLFLNDLIGHFVKTKEQKEIWL